MVVSDCPNCQGQRFDAVGMGIQKIEEDIVRLYPDLRILRIDSDTHEKRETLVHSLQNIDIILGTYNAMGLMSQVDHMVFALFESDLTIPEYRMEEEVFHAVDYAKKLGKNILIQTRMREHPLLDLIMEGNYKDFLSYMSHERELFGYPPYTQFVTIRIHDRSQARVKDIVTKLANKIELLKWDSIFFAYDRDIWEKSAGEWIQKIILKDKNLSPILDAIQGEILRNRAVTLQWN